jgi:hypothetical protein
LLFKLHLNGTRVTTFGGGQGFVAIKATAKGGTFLTGVNVDSSGTVTVGMSGYTTPVIGAVSLNPDGSRNTAYGSGTGRFTTTCTGLCGVQSVVTAQGVTFFGALESNNGTGRRLYLARVLPDGSGLDPSFGTAGQWSIRLAPTAYEYLLGAAPVGSKLVAVGGMATANGGEDALVTRLQVAA